VFTCLSAPSSSVFEFQTLLRLFPRQLDHQEARSIILSLIVENPGKLFLLRALVVAGRWDEFESLVVPHGGETACDILNSLESVSSRPIARDVIRECCQWEASLSAPMKAARRRDFDAFKKSISSDNPNILQQTDLLGFDVLFWALTGGHRDIICYLLERSSLQRLLS